MKAAEEAESVDKVYVSTDSHDYLAFFNHIIKENNFSKCYPVPRKSIHASSKAQLEDFILPFLYQNPCDNIIILQPTSPVRLPGTIDQAFQHFIETKADSLVSVTKLNSFIWRNKVPNYDPAHRPRSQEYDSGLYCENGSIYITKTDIFIEYKNRIGGFKIENFCLSDEEAFEIDTMLDFVICEAILKHLGKE